MKVWSKMRKIRNNKNTFLFLRLLKFLMLNLYLSNIFFSFILARVNRTNSILDRMRTILTIELGISIKILVIFILFIFTFGPNGINQKYCVTIKHLWTRWHTTISFLFYSFLRLFSEKLGFFYFMARRQEEKISLTCDKE